MVTAQEVNVFESHICRHLNSTVNRAPGSEERLADVPGIRIIIVRFIQLEGLIVVEIVYIVFLELGVLL